MDAKYLYSRGKCDKINKTLIYVSPQYIGQIISIIPKFRKPQYSFSATR